MPDVSKPTPALAPIEASIAPTLILGGVRSGKSRLAERLAVGSGLPVTLIATATAGDAEMAARIAAHQARRPADWTLIEEPLDLAGALREAAAPDRCVLVDCLTLWLTNLLCAPTATHGEPAPTRCEQAPTRCEHEPTRCEHEITTLLELTPRLPGPVIFVANEVNMGVMPIDALSRSYCDLAGSLHQRLAADCGRVVLTVAGLPLLLKGTSL